MIFKGLRGSRLRSSALAKSRDSVSEVTASVVDKLVAEFIFNSFKVGLLASF